ncbi:MAG: phospholipase D family protein [Sandaracinaceae bacterium]|nr:phospholipase D family protein [Sandaracinaceae bacterium]
MRANDGPGRRRIKAFLTGNSAPARAARYDRRIDLELTGALTLIEGRAHYERVVRAVMRATRSVWIATANLKELMVEDERAPGRRRRYRSVLDVLAERAERGVELRVLHAAPPSRPFRDAFDRLPALVRGGMELRCCPRVHWKLVVVDARLVYVGSANWTGAGLGARGDDKRNFEMGIVTEDDAILDAVQASFERVWSGAECARCRLRDRCEMPLDAM